MAITKKPARNQTAAPRDDDQAAAAFIAGAGAPNTPEQEPAESKRVPVMIRFDPDLLKLVDAAAKRRGISRSAWLQFTVSKALEEANG